MLDLSFYDADFWKHVSIPFVAAFVGWITNWVAIKLTFKPLEFVGIGRWLGWQGIIPSKASKMATIFVDRTMFRLGSLKELFERMNPDLIADHITEVMDRRLQAYTDEVMFYNHPGLWDVLPETLKQRVYQRVRDEMPGLIHNLMKDAADSVESLLDLKHMLVGRLERDKQLLNRLFLEAGAVEFRFIVRSGLYFGFLFGLVQLGVWTLYKSWWVLPAFGILVGYATNWFAINIIFRPLRPVGIGSWTVQGLFLKRQKEVAAIWCRLVTTEIFTLQHIMYAMLFGPNAEHARMLIRRHIEPVVDEVVESYAPLAGIAVGSDTRAQIRESVGEKAVAVSTDPFDHWSFNRDRSQLVEEILRERMEHLPPEEFQDLLRPCFQEDEMKLILTGAVLGFLAGIGQLVFVFGWSGY